MDSAKRLKDFTLEQHLRLRIELRIFAAEKCPGNGHIRRIGQKPHAWTANLRPYNRHIAYKKGISREPLVASDAVIVRHSSCNAQALYRQCDVHFEKPLGLVLKVWVTEWLVFVRVVKYKIPCVFSPCIVRRKQFVYSAN